MEIWKDIKGYEGLYQVSNYGQVRSVERVCYRSLPSGTIRKCIQKGRIIKPIINPGSRKGVLPRYQVGLSKECKVKSKQVHRLVAETFLGCTDEQEVNHKDGNPLNNHIDNLECVSRNENIKHAFDNHLYSTSKIVLVFNRITKELIGEFRSITKASEFVGVSQTGLGKKLKHNPDGIEIKEYFIVFK